MAMQSHVRFAGAILLAVFGLGLAPDSVQAQCDRLRLFSPGRFQPLRGRLQRPPALDCPPVEPFTRPKPTPVQFDLRVKVFSIAELLKQGDSVGARNLAVATAALKEVEDIAEVMQMYHPRNKGGLGWGPAPRPVAGMDGIERMIYYFIRGVSMKAAGEVNANETTAYWIMAVAELTLAKAPNYDKGTLRTKAWWIDRATKVRETAEEFRKASVAGNAKEMQKALERVNTACLTCHTVFRY